MGFWNKFDCFNYTYQSRFSVSECIQSILISQKTFGSNYFNPHNYEYVLLSNNQMRLVFKGARFSKTTKTEYLATFYDDANGCRIALNFQHEFLCLPPMTSTYLLDLFMEEKMQAYRCQN